jgi:DNA-damage-inducible protein J
VNEKDGILVSQLRYIILVKNITMVKSAMIRARIEPKLKNEVEKVFSKLGLSASEAIQLFYNQVRIHRGLPFEVKIPNEETRKVLREANKGVNVVTAKDTEDLFRKLGI